MDPLVGRAAELERTIQILARRQKNNPASSLEIGAGAGMDVTEFFRFSEFIYHVILPWMRLP